MFTTVFETVFFVIFHNSDRCSLCDLKVVEGGGGGWSCWRRSPLLSAQSGEKCPGRLQTATSLNSPHTTSTQICLAKAL